MSGTALARRSAVGPASITHWFSPVPLSHQRHERSLQTAALPPNRCFKTNAHFMIAWM